MGSHSARIPQTIIRPRKGFRWPDVGELMSYRDLLYFLCSRHIQIRYKQTILGGLWAIVQPLFMMLVFTLFFGMLAKVPSDNIPYPLFNLTAMVAWTYFSNALMFSSNSLVENQALISKVYFPRLLLPLAPVAAGLLDYVISLVVLVAMMIFYQFYPGLSVLLLPVLLLIMVLTACGGGALLAALNAKYRDVKLFVPLLLQLWLFCSPVVYPASMVPESYRLIYALNPMAGIIEGLRSVLLGVTPFPTELVLISALVGIVVFISGILYFCQAERHFADII